MSSGFLGEFAEGKIVLEKGLRNAWEINDRFITGWVELSYSILSYFEGDGDSVVDHAQKSIKCFEDSGAEVQVGITWSFLGAGYYLRGEYDKAIDPAEKGLKLAIESGLPFTVSWCYSNLAMIFRAAGDLKHARECAERSIKLAQEHKIKNCEGVAWMLLGSIKGKMDPARIDEAQQHIGHGISIVEELRQKSCYALGYLLSGELFVEAGRKEEALENLKKAESFYLEMKVTPKSYWLKRTREALAKLE